ncbi:MAG: UDP-N-acetylmuramate--L-alanine ligase [Bacteroidia bacterium]|jgi:UDP-N-acetylmuramate--alanine ligase
MNLDAVKYVYLIGAGGIGMSALGRYFLKLGIPVWGYDKTCVAFTQQLEDEGMSIVYEDRSDLIPDALLVAENRNAVLVIYTPAVPRHTAIVQTFTAAGVRIFKRAEVLGMLSRGHQTLAVAGTHGKTTTSTLVAHILKVAGKEPVAFLGGISTNYATNYLEGNSNSMMVVEADEYDRSFLHLHPHSSIITSTDADHLDIYGDRVAMQESFTQFARQTNPKGYLLVKKGLDFPADIATRAITYHTSEPADVVPLNIKLEGDRYHFSLKIKNAVIENLELGLPGLHNLENALAASAICYLNGVTEVAISEALRSFAGVKRRFEYIVRKPDFVFIDDYAHHPEELRACISSVRAIYPGRRITGVFQPHLFSRTRDFLDGFARSLELLDEVILLEIYPARELPIEGITSAALLERIHCSSKQLCTKEELTERISALRPEVLLTLGAGDIDALVQPLKNRLEAETV